MAKRIEKTTPKNDGFRMPAPDGRLAASAGPPHDRDRKSVV